MLFYADLHIHSKYSRATAKNCDLENLAIYAQRKGIDLLATGDFTHPIWLNELKEKLIPNDNGFFKLKDSNISFMLSAEISTIYKHKDKVRKVHHLIYAPDFASVDKIIKRLKKIGNLKSDGRPILGLKSRELLEIVLESNEKNLLIPAHIWTPWFSVLGSKSGYDSIEDCYEDLTPYIYAVETGLSSDPAMNWRVSFLDKYRLVSFSDAHSPSKLARELTSFKTKLTYDSLVEALKTGKNYDGTIEFFPEHGKYYLDGHRNCNLSITPKESKKYNYICPICKKKITLGVLHRVEELADRPLNNTFKPASAGEFISLVPLEEILAEIRQLGPNTKTVQKLYEDLLKKFGNEIFILRDLSIKEITKENEALGLALNKLRQGQVRRIAGYDGEYGKILCS